MPRSRSLALGAAVGVLSVGGVAASQAASTPKSAAVPSISAGAQVDRAFQERLGKSLSERAAKAGQPQKPERSAAKLASTADQHRGRVTAARALQLTRQGAPDLALSTDLIPEASKVESIINDRVVQVTGAGGSDLTRGLLGKDKEKATRLVVSNMPMAALKDPGAKGPAEFELANIDWKAAGDRYTLARPVSQVSLPKAAGGLVRLQNGLGVRLASAGSTAEGHATGETVTYPNVGTDTDMVVRSLPTGLGVGWTLRSPSATREITVPMDLPAGQTLRREPTGAVSVIGKDGDVESAVTPATAIDADHQPVALTTKVDGDSIVYDVDHAEGKVAYPVTVDPYVYSATWNTGQSTNIDGWFPQNTPEINAPYQYLTPNGQQGSILGIYGPAGYYARLESAAWGRFPPGDPSVPRGPSSGHARWTQFVAGSVGYTIAPTQNYHYSNYASGQIFIADSGGNIQNTVGQLPAPTSGATYTLNASGGGLTIDNVLGFGLTLGPYFFQYDHPASIINMGYFQATTDDPTPPAETVSGNEGWLGENGAVTATATDRGFGPKTLGLQREDTSAIGSFVTRDCPAAQVTAAMICPYNWSQSFPIAEAPEGISTQYAVSGDANNSASRAAFTLKVDKTPPQRVLSGSLWEQRDMDRGTPDDDDDDNYGLLSSDGALHVEAADANSGVASVEVLIDNRRLNADDRADAACSATAGCPTSLTADITIPNKDVTEGLHAITVVVRDQIADPNGAVEDAHTRVERFNVFFSPDPAVPDGEDDDTPPDPVASARTTSASGAQPLSSGSPYATPVTGSYAIVLKDLQNESANPTSDFARIVAQSSYSVEEAGEMGDGQNPDGSPHIVGHVALVHLDTPQSIDTVVNCFATRADRTTQTYKAHFVAKAATQVMVVIDGATQKPLCISPGPDNGPSDFIPVPGQPALPVVTHD